MHCGSLVGDVGKAQLRIQLLVVVPRQPVGRVELFIRQAHHLGEARVLAIHLIDHTLRGDDVLVADDLHRSVVDAGEALLQTLTSRQHKWTALHLIAANEDMHRGRQGTDVRDPQLRIQSDIIVPGQPVGIIQLVGRQPHHLGEAGVDTIHLVDHALCSENRGTVGIDDLHRTAVYAWKASALTLMRG